MADISKVYEIGKKLSEVESKYSALAWTQYTTGFDFGISEAYEKVLEVYNDKENYDIICDHLNKDMSYEDKRRVEIIYNSFKPYHLSKELNELDMEIQKKTTELSNILNTHRAVFENREISSVELTQILYNDEDRERRKAAFLARGQVNKPLVDGGFTELIKLRKEYAKLYGAKDFVSYKLNDDELDDSLFSNWINELHDMLPEINKKREYYAKKFLNDDRIMPWDELYINSRIAPSLNTMVGMPNYYQNVSEFFKLFGIDITKYNITYDIFPRANKSEWGYNFTIAEGKDSRILANVKNKYHEYGVLLHETGHAVHSFSVNPDDILLNMGISGIISEGIANLFGGLIHDKIFYKRFFDDECAVEKEFSEIREYKNLTGMLAIHNIFFDHELYRNKINTLDDIYELYWKTYSDILKEEPFADIAPWGNRIHFTTHPIYLHNYFMGDVTCAMLSSVFKKKAGVNNITEKPMEFGEFLMNDVIKTSGLYKFQDLFKKISGEEFSLKYMMDK